MTCHETREQLSELLDEALEPRARAAVSGHVAECAECRRELERLRATVGFLRRVEPARAPAGFVDRVLERARSAAWYRRLVAWLFLPLPVKLPAQAAAMAVVAGLAVYLIESDPGLRDAVRQRPPAPIVRPEPPPESPPPAATPAPRPASRPPASVPAAPGPQSADPAAEVSAGAGASAGGATQSYSSREGAAESTVRKELQAESPPAAPPPRLSAASPRPGAADARARPGEPTAVSSLTDLLARVGGTEATRRSDGPSTVVEVEIPRARQADFELGLESLGSWTIEGAPAASPREPTRLRFTLRSAR